MSPAVDRELLAERAAAVGRHLDRVARHLPGDPAELRPDEAATDTVILHLWQAVQVVIDMAVSTCVQLGLASPPTYADAFRRLANARVIPQELAERLARAAGFRNLVVHAYGRLDLQRVHATATSGPADLRAFLAALRDHADGTEPTA
ncbi:MAG: type VII toxin-antitoxin system HepT family RNase toxin [Pseudonocardiaceae bacterium]